MQQVLTIAILLLSISTQAQNVGIGTAQPDQKLVVEGDRIKLQNKDSTKLLYLRTDGSEIDITTIGSHFWITAEADKNIILNNNIYSSGNVGIGTIYPSEKLEVDGAVKISSLQGEGSRLLCANEEGLLIPCTINIAELQQTITNLQTKLAQQEALIQTLIKKNNN